MATVEATEAVGRRSEKAAAATEGDGGSSDVSSEGGGSDSGKGEGSGGERGSISGGGSGGSGGGGRRQQWRWLWLLWVWLWLWLWRRWRRRGGDGGNGGGSGGDGEDGAGDDGGVVGGVGGVEGGGGSSATAARAAAAARRRRGWRVTVVTATAAAVERTPTRVVGAPKELNHAALHSRCGPAELCSIVLPGWPEAARGPAYTWIDATRAWAWARARDGGTGLSPTIELHSPHVRRDAARPLRTAGDAVHIRETLCATRARWRHHFDRAANLAREVQPHAGLRQSPGARDRAVTGSWVSSMRWRHLLQSHPRLPQTKAQVPRQPPSRTQPQRAWGRARSGTGTGIRPGGRSIHLLVPVYVRFN